MMTEKEAFDPGRDVIPLRFEYHGIRISGYARGQLKGKVSIFEVFSGIGNFSIEAYENSPSHYKWRSLSLLFPRQEIIKIIGKGIERFFRNPGIYDKT